MKIVVYGTPHDGLSGALRDRLRRVGLDYESRDIRACLAPDGHVSEDERVAVAAASAAWSQSIPLISIDGQFFNYASGWREIVRRTGMRPKAT